jgi:hypothetical protein
MDVLSVCASSSRQKGFNDRPLGRRLDVVAVTERPIDSNDLHGSEPQPLRRCVLSRKQANDLPHRKQTQ